MQLSIIIVNWNTKSLLLNCLRSVADAVSASDMKTEVFVVDNASTDGSVNAVRTKFPSITLVQNTRNVGFAAGNNVALKSAAGKYCLLLNTDTVVPRGTFDQLVAVMDASRKTAVCSPLLLNGDGTPQFCWARFPDAASELMGRLDRSQSPYPLDDFASAERRITMESFPVDWVGGACYLVRREAIEEAGLLDEGFFMFSEETEWCHRFARHGWRTLLVPFVTVTHLGGQTAKSVPAATREQMYRSIVRLYTILYGKFGAVLPAAVATLRYRLSPLRNRRANGKPVQ